MIEVYAQVRHRGQTFVNTRQKSPYTPCVPATYHNHSTFSDGRAPVREVVEHARDLGADEVGLSDHLTLHPSKRVRWSMEVARLDAYVQTVLDARDEMRGSIEVRLGVELDWFDGREDVLRAVIESKPFDYIIGSVHFVGEFPIDGAPQRWRTLDQDVIDQIHRDYWTQMRKMVASGLFDIAAHLDLPKKFGHLPREQPQAEIDAALDALAENDVVVELNTAGWRKACADAYPSLEILRACRERGIAATLSADAHDPADLLRDFDRGRERLREAGYAEVAWFAGRERRMRGLGA